MVSSNMYTLTQALRSAIIDPETNDTNGKPGPSFEELDRMEDFWIVRFSSNSSLFRQNLFDSTWNK